LLTERFIYPLSHVGVEEAQSLTIYILDVILNDLTCFKAYDIRGEIGVDIDPGICYRIGRATGQHFNAGSVVIGFDARETSPAFAEAAAQGARDSGADVIDIGLAGTEEMYWAVTEFGASAGIEITASHNPINYNGMKIIKAGSEPLDNKEDFLRIKSLAETEAWITTTSRGSKCNRSEEARLKYVDRVLGFVDLKVLQPLKIVVDSGDGAAGPTFDAIAKSLCDFGIPIEFFRANHKPNSKFPNGIPNPLLVQNHSKTANIVKKVKADFGVAFDGDFDRCFFFDENGIFVPSEYVVGLLASVFLEREIGAKIVHDCRLIWNTEDVVKSKSGISIQSKTGHAFIKQKMREHGAVYGGEMSAHHYFRDFAYCDSGMIPWMMISELISTSSRSLGELVRERLSAFPSSGEINFLVEDPQSSIEKVKLFYSPEALSMDATDGISFTFDDWRFNLRSSNTEPLVRLNIEAKGNSVLFDDLIEDISKLLGAQKL